MVIAVDQNYDKAQRKISTANLAQFAGVDCQLLVEKETHRPVVMNGTTLGGAFKCASTAEVNAVKDTADSALTYLAQTPTPEQKQQVMANLADTWLPLSGGEMLGPILAVYQNILHSYADDKYVNIDGGTSYENGASLTLYGKTNANKGMFVLRAADGPNASTLTGTADGNLAWNGKIVERVSAKGNGYIRYEYGLQICWGAAQTGNNGGQYVGFQVPFSETPIVVGALSGDLSGANKSYGSVFVQGIDGIGCNVWVRFDNKPYAGAYVFWIAIGMWK